jgi:16S rRNA processing protein RimM
MSYFNIGKFAASHGLSGELILQHNLGKKTALKGLEVLFIEDKKDSFLPHFIESTSIKSDTEIYVKLEGIDNKEIARKLTPKPVWLQEEDFKKNIAKAAPIGLLGYELFDVDKSVGEIIEVIEQPHQMLVAIIHKGNEALIPIHEDNIIKMDDKKRKLYIEIPDGLLEVYE